MSCQEISEKYAPPAIPWAALPLQSEPSIPLSCKSAGASQRYATRAGNVAISTTRKTRIPVMTSRFIDYRWRVTLELTRPGLSPVAMEKLPDSTSSPY